jgi:predicted acetyltransferase
MKISLRELVNSESNAVFDMFNEIPEKEAGFGNKLNGLGRAEFDKVVGGLVEESKATVIMDGYRVPQTHFILFVDDTPVGFSKLRHFLTPELLKNGGHIGYGISPKHRGKGHAKRLLAETLKKARDMNIKKVLITCNDDNIASYKTAEACGGVLENKENGTRRYWIGL